MFKGGAWLTGEQGIRMLLGVFLGAWAARYLGPADFGALSGTLAVISVVGVGVSLGLNSILVRELATSPESAGEILATAFWMRLVVSGCSWLVCVAVVLSRSGADTVYSALLPLAGLALLFQSMDGVERQLQVQGQLNRLAKMRMVAMLCSNGLRVALILSHASVIGFALAWAVEVAVSAIGMAVFAGKNWGGYRQWSFSKSRAAAMLREGVPLMVASFAIQIHGSFDQIMIAAFCANDQLGQYAAAFRLISVFSFLPMVIQAVASPEIARAKRDDALLYRRRLHGLHRLTFLAGLGTALPVALFGPFAIILLFGGQYREAAMLLPFMAVRLFLTNMGVSRAVFMNTEGMPRFILITAVVGAVLNVGLNFIFIPVWGPLGAVLTSTITFSVTIFGLEWMDPRARDNLSLMLSAVLRPWRAYR